MCAPPSAAPQRGPSAIYGIAPLVLLARAPGQAVFTERALSAALPPGLIADSASSRRYAVELGLFERQGDVYRLSGGSGGPLGRRVSADRCTALRRPTSRRHRG